MPKAGPFAGLLLIAVGALLTGCYKSPWPAAPNAMRGRELSPSAIEWSPDGRYGARFVEGTRGGVKRSFYLDANNDGTFAQVADLDRLDPAQIRWVYILLDGIPYKLFDDLYTEGHFRLFLRPSRFVSTFPSLTDVSYSSLFGIPGSSCYESIVFDRQTNTVHDGLDVYTSRANELWSTALDYHQKPRYDGLAYLRPRAGVRRELPAMFTQADTVLQAEPSRQHVLIYAMSTNAQNQAGDWQESRRMMLELEKYIERLVYQQKGKIGLVILASPGNNFVAACKKVDLEASIRGTGLNPVIGSGFGKGGDVVILRYGLVSVISAFTQNDQDKMKLVDAMLKTNGIEHIIWRAGPSVRIARRGGRAEIRYHLEPADGAGPVEYFSYTCTEGDPLELGPILSHLNGRMFGNDGQTYYSAGELLEATAQHRWPDPLWRIWHGMTDAPAVVPDVVGSLALGWYYGNRQFDHLAKINGTHGGLRDWDSVGFFATNMFAAPAVMRTTDVLPLLNERTGWVPRIGDPNTQGLGAYLKTPVNPLAVWPLREYQRAARAGRRPAWSPPATMPATGPEMLPALPECPPGAMAPSARIPSGIVAPAPRPQERFVAPPTTPAASQPASEPMGPAASTPGGEIILPPASRPASEPTAPEAPPPAAQTVPPPASAPAAELAPLEQALPPATGPAPLSPWTSPPPPEPAAPGQP
jgi:hypothetical protein